MGISGRATVAFNLRDGVPSQIRVTISSGVGMLDQAAIAAVSSAAYPEAPDTLKGQDKPYTVIVYFELKSG